MILAKLSDAERYLDVHPLFRQAFAWLAEPGNPFLPPGRHPIRGEEIFALVQEGPTKDAAGVRFESHRRYADIHAVVSGGERIGWAPTAGLAIVQDFEQGGDIAFHADPPAFADLALESGTFAVFFPEDAHRPATHLAGEPGVCRKVVLKVLVR